MKIVEIAGLVLLGLIVELFVFCSAFMLGFKSYENKIACAKLDKMIEDMKKDK